jgi:hypothetical protein
MKASESACVKEHSPDCGLRRSLRDCCPLGRIGVAVFIMHADLWRIGSILNGGRESVCLAELMARATPSEPDAAAIAACRAAPANAKQ